MGERKVRSLMVVCVLLVLLSGNFTAADFGPCYASCLIPCAATKGPLLVLCSFACLKHCLLSSTPVETNNREETQQQFCKLGCAVSMCANISSKSNPEEEKVAACVNSCSGGCDNKNYTPGRA